MLNDLILGFKRIIREKPEIPIAIASWGITIWICRWKKKDWAETTEIGRDVGSLAYQSTRLVKKLRSRDPVNFHPPSPDLSANRFHSQRF